MEPFQEEMDPPQPAGGDSHIDKDVVEEWENLKIK